MVAIRLSRFGSKKKPFYRIVVIDSRKARDSRPLEYLGFVNPLKKSIFKLNEKRLKHWISVGAKTSATVLSLVKKNLKL